MTHGGKRAGAGRKLGARALITRSRAEAILATVNEEKIWQRLLRNPNARIVLDAMKYLTDRRDGRPVQAVNAEIGGHLDIAARVAERLSAARKQFSRFQTPERQKESRASGEV
jgi:hypothetical protein